jgi:hypothetical protein
MRRILVLIVAAATVANVLTYCVRPPDYPVEPVIEFVAVSPGTILQRPFFSNPDTVYTNLTFSFTDGDGDLGVSDTSSVKSIIIRESRSPEVPKDYRFPLVDPQGAGNGISGDVTVRIPVSCCIPDPLNGVQLPPCDPNSPSGQLRDTLIYTIQIKDRAGNLSNVIQTAPIVLICKQ